MEVNAEWETYSESRIWGEFVLNGQSGFSGKKYGINALCNENTIKKTLEIRKIALKALENEYGTDNSGEIYAVILEDICKISANPITSKEKKLVYNSFSSKKKLLLPDQFNHTGNSKILQIFLSSTAMLPVQTSISLTNLKFKNNNINNDNYRNNLNLSDYSIHSTKADYFKLFLYIWEDSPGLVLISLYNNSLLCYAHQLHKSSHFFSKSFKHKISNQKVKTRTRLQTIVSCSLFFILNIINKNTSQIKYLKRFNTNRLSLKDISGNPGINYTQICNYTMNRALRTEA